MLQISDRILFYASCGLAAYFGFLLLDAFLLHIDFVLVGVFRELLTIPAVVLLLFLLVLTTIRWFNAKFKVNGYLFLSLSLLMITCATIVLVTVLEKPRTTSTRVETTVRYSDES